MPSLETSRTANEATPVGRPLIFKMVHFDLPEGKGKGKSESKKAKRGRKKADKENSGISVGNASSASQTHSPKRSAPPQPTRFVTVNEWNKRFTVRAPIVAKQGYRDVIFRYAAPDDEDYEASGEYYQLAAAKYDNDLMERLAGEPDNDNATLEVDSNELHRMEEYINWIHEDEEVREYWYGP